MRLTDEGLTTPGTTFTSPWTDAIKSPDTRFVNTMTQTALPRVNANTSLDSTSINAMAQTMSPTDKVESWFSPTPAGPSQSLMSCPNTRHTALTFLARDQSQLPVQNTGDAFFSPAATDPSLRGLLLGSSADQQSQLTISQLNRETINPGSSTAHRSNRLTSHRGTRDLFFDSVPTGPSQLSTSRWNARAPAFDPWKSTQDQAPTSPWNMATTSPSPGKHP